MFALARLDAIVFILTICADIALADMRRRLALCNIDRPREFALHDFRRGHADDMREKGASLNLILSAGEWKSAAFMSYMNAAELERRAVLEAHYAASDEED